VQIERSASSSSSTLVPVGDRAHGSLNLDVVAQVLPEPLDARLNEIDVRHSAAGKQPADCPIVRFGTEDHGGIAGIPGELEDGVQCALAIREVEHPREQRAQLRRRLHHTLIRGDQVDAVLQQLDQCFTGRAHSCASIDRS